MAIPQILDFRLDESTNDIKITDGDIEVITDEKEFLAQRLLIKLRTFLGEWFLNQNFGIPYFESVLGHNVDLGDIQSIFINAINSTPGTKDLLQLDLDFDVNTRKLLISGEVESEFPGDAVSFSGQVPP